MTFGIVIDEIGMGYQPSSWLALHLLDSFHSFLKRCATPFKGCKSCYDFIFYL
jgi:hypothetical protein